MWVCSACTFENNDAASRCSVCNGARSLAGEPWACEICTETNPASAPSCGFCGDSRPGAPAPHAPAVEPPVARVDATISQYSLHGGRSACTSIALVAAARMLPLHAAHSGPSVDLDDIVATGVGVHSATVAGDAEHRSVEEALFGFEACGRAGLVGGLAAVGMHQGVLQPSPQPFIETVEQLRHAARGAVATATSVAITITKPPETVVIIVPMQDDPDAAAPDLVRYWLFDSHPRQLPAFTTPAAALLGFASLPALCTALSSVFPHVDLGEDVGMDAMYNAFDATALVLAQQPALPDAVAGACTGPATEVGAEAGGVAQQSEAVGAGDPSTAPPATMRAGEGSDTAAAPGSSAADACACVAVGVAVGSVSESKECKDSQSSLASESKGCAEVQARADVLSESKGAASAEAGAMLPTAAASESEAHHDSEAGSAAAEAMDEEGVALAVAK